MSLKRALSRLETSAAKSSDELLPHLARLLGIVDSICWPARFTSTSNYHAVMDSQQRYFDEGVSFTLEGGSDATWKQSERLRSSLVDAGWASHCDNGKIRLTLLGDCVARHAAGLPTIENPITKFLYERVAELPEDRQGRWVAESSILGDGHDWEDSAKWYEFTECLMPLVVHRCIESASSTIARCFYRRIVDSLPSVDCPSVEYDASCSDQYTKAFCRNIELRKSAEYSGSQIWIPLAATR
jgi:hypothetical protein